MKLRIYTNININLQTFGPPSPKSKLIVVGRNMEPDTSPVKTKSLPILPHLEFKNIIFSNLKFCLHGPLIFLYIERDEGRITIYGVPGPGPSTGG